jgi:hypothetical protein
MGLEELGAGTGPVIGRKGAKLSRYGTIRR